MEFAAAKEQPRVSRREGFGGRSQVHREVVVVDDTRPPPGGIGSDPEALGGL